MIIYHRDCCLRCPQIIVKEGHLVLMIIKDNSLYQQLIFSDFVPYESFVLDVQSSDDEQDQSYLQQIRENIKKEY